VAEKPILEEFSDYGSRPASADENPSDATELQRQPQPSVISSIDTKESTASVQNAIPPSEEASPVTTTAATHAPQAAATPRRNRITLQQRPGAFILHTGGVIQNTDGTQGSAEVTVVRAPVINPASEEHLLNKARSALEATEKQLQQSTGGNLVASEVIFQDNTITTHITGLPPVEASASSPSAEQPALAVADSEVKPGSNGPDLLKEFNSSLPPFQYDVGVVMRLLQDNKPLLDACYLSVNKPMGSTGSTLLHGGKTNVSYSSIGQPRC
jgi:hypothetical protein